jgi:thymidine kinase
MGNQHSTLADANRSAQESEGDETLPTPGSGVLELVIGPMFSGKTQYLVDKFAELKASEAYGDTVVINHASDTRYTGPGLMSTHTKTQLPCLTLTHLTGLRKTHLRGPTAILINEANFFDDLYDFAIEEVEQQGSLVIVAGLDGDFRRQPFGDVLRLIPFADTVTRLTAQCVNCDQRPALFSRRVGSDSTEQRMVGASIYRPMCRQCYLLFEAKEDESDSDESVDASAGSDRSEDSLEVLTHLDASAE